jgi:hypothetical protein
VDAQQIDVAQILEQRFDGEPPHPGPGSDLAQGLDACEPAPILN